MGIGERMKNFLPCSTSFTGDGPDFFELNEQIVVGQGTCPPEQRSTDQSLTCSAQNIKFHTKSLLKERPGKGVATAKESPR